MDIATMAGLVGVVTQSVKDWVTKWGKIRIEGSWAVVLSFFVSALVALYGQVVIPDPSGGDPTLNFSLLVPFRWAYKTVAVFLLANGGYSLLKRFGVGKNE